MGSTQPFAGMSGRRPLFAALSPVALIAICIPMQHLAGQFLGVWAWVPTMLLFWVAIAAAVLWFAGRDAITRWLQPAQGSALWAMLAVGMGLLSLPGFLMHWQIALAPPIVFFWLVFGLVNPWFEEAYWRGLLMDATASWGGVASVAWSAAWFTLSHPLVWGVHSTAMRQWPVVAALFFVGAVWATVSRRSRSIRWTIAGHMLANLLGMAVPVLLNLYDPVAR